MYQLDFCAKKNIPVNPACTVFRLGILLLRKKPRGRRGGPVKAPGSAAFVRTGSSAQLDLNPSAENTKPCSSWSLNIHPVANFSWEETCSKWNSLSAMLRNSSVSYKKGFLKALVLVLVFKCKIAADVPRGVCTVKATQILAAPRPSSCRTLSSLCFLTESVFLVFFVFSFFFF